MPVRYLLAVGTAEYDDTKTFVPLPGVNRELDTVDVALRSLGYRVAPGFPLHDPSSEHWRAMFTEWMRAPDRMVDDIVTVYVTGHGAVTDGGEHYCCVRTTQADNIVGTAIASDDLARWLGDGTRPRRFLLLLDLCYAGEGAQAFGEKALRLLRGRDRTVAVVASARHGEEAHLHRFAEAFKGAVANADGRLGGDRAPLLHFSSVLRALRGALEQAGADQRIYPIELGDELDDFLPNPRYRPDLPEGIDLAHQQRLRHLSQEELRSHFGPRSRGVESVEQLGDYFTGREAVLAHLRSWLTRDHGAGALRWLTCSVIGGSERRRRLVWRRRLDVGGTVSGGNSPPR